MSNMTYCMFENTAADLRDCVNALNGINDAEKALSPREFKAFCRILKMAFRLNDDYRDFYGEELKGGKT